MDHAIVVDLGYGDAGKGSFVDYLCETRPYKTVVRFNGGSQAAHRVVRSDGREHVFRQYGSGTFVRDTRTVLSRWMLVDPLALTRETDLLEARSIYDPLDRIAVHVDALVTTPLHATANRIEENARGAGRHGSCGAGIGKTREYSLQWPDDALYVRDLSDLKETIRKLELMASRLGQPSRPNGMNELAESYRRFVRHVDLVDDRFMYDLLNGESVVFEGAQGVLLDENWGFPPYYTWTTTTPANALITLEAAGLRDPSTRTIYGLTRSYSTRHGAGPFPTESPAMAELLPDADNRLNAWQGEFRVGPLDLVGLRYAVDACQQVDQLVVSCLDRLEHGETCTDYLTPRQEMTRSIPLASTEFMRSATPFYQTEPLSIVEQVQDYLKIPVTVASYGVTARDKKEL